MNISIQVLSTSVETKPTAKGSYQQLEVAYKDLSNAGKVTSKKLMSFSNKMVFDRMATAKPADVFDVTMEKDDKGYWNWKEVKKGSVTADTTVKQAVTSSTQGATNTKGNWETSEERAKKQVYIVRQSSISAAVTALTATGKTIPDVQDIIKMAREFEAFVFEVDKVNDVVRQDVDFSDLEDPIPF